MTYAAPPATARPRAVAIWLLLIAAMVFGMVVVGGITRLTESGLSMVRWEPIKGVLPPMNADAWAREFAAYQASPQYQSVNAGMTLAAFKGIYFWEYLHRLLARSVGVAFALPLLWFAWRRAIPPGYGLRLGIILALGALQGAIGWWMVASGLVDRPAVAHERLATHLLMALAIMSACLWTALDLLGAGRPVRVRRPTGWIVPFFVLLVVQIGFGAFVAGLRAGHMYNMWPLMGDGLVPPDMGIYAPLWRNLLDNPVTIQFVHRSLAVVVAVAAIWVATRLVRAGAPHHGGALAAMVLVQFALGVLTLVHDVPIPLGVAHQAGAALLLGVSVIAAHWCWQGRGASLRA